MRQHSERAVETLGVDELRAYAAELLRRLRAKDKTIDALVEHEEALSNRSSAFALFEQNVKLEREKEAADAASRAKSDLLATMSHELRTPLNAVIGFSDLLAAGDYGPLDTRQKLVMNDIRAAGQQLLTLINDVLDLSKIEAGRMDVHLVPVDVGDTVSQACALVASAARQRSIQICRSIPEARILASADPDRLRQVLLNLLSNAVKFTPEGGSVTIDAHLNAGRLQVAVTDTGIGIAAADAPKLFAPFSQLDGGMTRRFQGTGLGLSICKKLVELMGGEIGFESEPGRGSTFFFTLALPRERRALTPLGIPTVRAPSVVPLRAEARSSAARALLRILVVDDSQVNRKVLRAMLESAAPCEVIEVADATRGIHEARRKAPAVILMDVQMPDLDGLAATAKLKADPSTSAIPVIAVTAHAMAGDAERAHTAGCIAYVTKPISRARLRDALDLALGGPTWRTPP